MFIEVKKLNDKAKLPCRATADSAGADLFDKGQRGNDNGGFVHGACHAAHVPTRYVREERATAGSDYTAICGSEVSSPQRATLSDQQFLYRPCAAGAIR